MSGSAFISAQKHFSKEFLSQVKIASIGPVTSKIIKDANLEVFLEAKKALGLAY